jgi:hypothetical protein
MKDVFAKLATDFFSTIVFLALYFITGDVAIGAIMLKRGWMLRYLPPIVTETIPEYVTIAGYAWAVLMFALGLGVIAVAATGDIKLWALYVSVVAIGAKAAAFAIQYAAFRILITNRIRAARA